jgi:hypothetical protein
LKASTAILPHFLKGNTMFRIYKLVSEADETLWAVIFDNTELVAKFKYVEDAKAFASFKETEYKDAEQALLDAYSLNFS